MSELKLIAPSTYLLPITGEMKVPGLLIANEELLKQIEIDRPLEQVKNVAHLPGIVGYSIAMPDIHWGYGFPIGGVAATSIEKGVISPGGVGYDINCGVRLVIVPIPFKDLSEKKKDQLLKSIFHYVPSGVGKGHNKEKGLSEKDYHFLLEKGAQWAIQQGYGFENDLTHTESNGTIEGADYHTVSEAAKERGRFQLGSIGSGNHFVEIGEIQKILLEEIGKEWGIEVGLTYVLIHSGSRGFGHQVCQDNLNSFIKQGFTKDLPDKQLVAAPIKSSAGQHYFSSMACAANFAFNNRQLILHSVRKAFSEIFDLEASSIKLLYDVCHNIAKFETHDVDGKKQKLCIHRKGATRAFGPGSKELSPLFQKTGQPVLVPGDMARASYLLVGLGNPLTWSSCCHGAGRALSRFQSSKKWKGIDLITHMWKQGIKVMASSNKTIAEEMSDAYKDVDLVVQAVQEAKLANIVARLKPHLVIKG